MARLLILATLPLVAALLFIAAAVLYFREHSRRMRGHGLTPVGAVSKSAAPGAAASAPVPALSPWLAAGSLMALGTYLAYDNVIDDSEHTSIIKFLNPACSITYSAPVETRPTGVVVIELSTQDQACDDRVRRAELIIDGVAAKDPFPFSYDGTAFRRRWLAPALSVGEHRIDTLDSAESETTPLSRTLVPADAKPGHRSAPKAPVTRSSFCNSVLNDPDPPGLPNQFVSVSLTTDCGPEKAAPSLIVNGTIDTAFLALTRAGKRYTYMWFVKRTALPDRVDVVFANPQVLHASQIDVREPVGIGGVKDVLASAGGAVVALSGLLVAILQFLRGQATAPA